LPKTRPPRVNPRPNVPSENAPIATALRHLLLLRAQRLAAALFPERAARAQAQVEVFDDLGRLVYHGVEFIGWVGGDRPDSPRLRPARRQA
jgi:hypothetical protein